MKRVRIPGLIISFEPNGRLLARASTQGKGARLPAIAVGLLSFCEHPRSREEAIQAFGPSGGPLFDGLCDAGLLADPLSIEETPEFFANFASIDIHRRMLADKARLDLYQAAIEEVVQPGDTVIDAGCGSGVLACMAATAGAQKVHAVDNSDIIELAERVVDRSDLGAKISCTKSEINVFKSPELVDVILTETFGAFALAEGSLADIQACVKTNLKKSGRVIPYAISLHLAPTHSRELFEEAFGPFEGHKGFNLAPLAEAAQSRAYTTTVPPKALLCAAKTLWHFDYPSPTPTEPAKAIFEIEKPATLFGFVGWFTLHMSPSHDLDTGPESRETHWHQVYFPMKALALAPNERLVCEGILSVPPDDPRGLELTLNITTLSSSNHNFFRIR